MVVVATRRDERSLIPHALLKLESEHADAEVERALKIRHLEVDVADVDPRIDRGTHTAIVTARLEA